MRGGAKANVVLDTNVIIDLVKLDALDTVCRLHGKSFFVVDEVVGEVTRPDQREALSKILASGAVSRVSLSEPEELELNARLRRVLDIGEAASMACAAHRGFAVASDEKTPKFMRELRLAVGESRLVRTSELLVHAIEDRVLDIGTLRLRVQALRASACSPRAIDDVAHLDRVVCAVSTQVAEEDAP